MKATALPAATEQYEALRQHAAAREPIFSAAPLGTILVVQTGVAGWIQQWRQRAGEVPARPLPPSPRSSDAAGWQHELTLLLAQMTVRHLSGSDSQL